MVTLRKADWVKPLPSQSELCGAYEHAVDAAGYGYLKMKKDSYHFNGKKRGERAAKSRKNGYVIIPWKKSMFSEHRIVWKMVNGVDPVFDIDHINGIRHDNRPENLRDVMPYLNARNRIKSPEYPGIQLTKHGYVVRGMHLSFCNLKLALEYQMRMEKVLIPLMREFKEKNSVATSDLEKEKYSDGKRNIE